jgi:RNA polymerase sigma-70 factor (ECF subfamily)
MPPRGHGGVTLDDTRRPAADPVVTDRDLLVLMQADDLDAFEQFFRRHRSLIERTAQALTGDPHIAEEVLQDTFLRAYRHRRTLRLDVSPVPWLYRVAINLCYSRLGRRRLPTEPIGDSTTAGLRDHAPEPAELAERAELRQAIRRGIAALPEKHQLVIVLYYLNGLSLQETADALGIRLGTAKSRIHYALLALREHLAGERHPEPAAVRHPIPAVIPVRRARR